MFFIGMIPNKGMVLDIGANIGITTVPLAKALPNASVFSYEPMPHNAKALRRVVQASKLKNVSVFETALDEREGELKMVLPVINGVKMQGLSHVYEEGNSTDWNKGDLFTVPVKQLDRLPNLQAATITAIKIDVENFEYNVLKGGQQLLAKNKPLIYTELWENEKKQQCIDYLQGLGYQTKVFEGNQLVPYTGQANEVNYFFVP